MRVDGAMHHTLSYLIPGDMALNWFLDFALVFFSSVVEVCLGHARSRQGWYIR
jgi:hypothetical protein